MTLAQLLPTNIEGAFLWIVAVLSLVQIAPIKINPWGWLGKQIGEALTGDLVKEMRNLREEFDTSIVNQSRQRILRFNDELLREDKHSKEFFDTTLEDIDAFEKYCLAHPDYKDSKTFLAIANIRRCYQKCEIEGNFLH